MSLGGTGSHDWVIQRLSAVYLAFYILFLASFVLFTHELTHEAWQGLFSQHWMQIGTLLALISLSLHAWIGTWVVITDYLKPLTVRYLAQVFIFLVLFSYLVWGVMILWG